MNPSKPFYEQLRQMLIGLEFEEESQRGVYIFFAVDDSEPLLRYAWHEPVTTMDIVDRGDVTIEELP